ncbi:PD-(D/E)XK nuclease family protein [Lapidilactobacillus bayanensis]|uniref:PD-(D/E)XK nuclease family protein n=1 Tax=Lapidilactobacillus bayanensis TaxID=2485998 RepID=UPI000F777487|nr:PD-(D/E)XK nuclease family protein [Lapidilactobacillus bayanensis]
MTMKFIVGRQQDDVNARLYQQISDDYATNQQQQFICLVPNHIKFNSEVQILSHLADAQPNLATKGIIASSRLQILSFSRLLWYFLRDDPKYQQPQLSPAAQAMFLSNFLHDQREKLPLFFGESRKMGFLEQLGQQLNELLQGNFAVADLQEMLTKLPEQEQVPGSTLEKLNELSFIFENYQSAIANKFITNEQLMAYFIGQTERRDFTNFKIYLAGFSELNQQQAQLIHHFDQQGATVYLTLYLNPDLKNQDISAQYYFHGPLKMLRQFGYTDLGKIAPENWLSCAQKRTSSALQVLEDYWIDSTNGLPTTAQMTTAMKQDVQIWRVDSLTSEVRGVANYIRQLVALQNYRYRDFLVLADNLPDYTATIAALFKQNEIPFFSDQQIPMANYPLVVFIKSLLTITQNPQGREDLFVLLRTELLVPVEMSLTDFRQQLDWLENYALAFGIRGATWLNPQPWTIDGPYVRHAVANNQLPPEQAAQMAAIENLHQFIAQVFNKWRANLKKVVTAKDFASCLYDFLNDQHVIATLQHWEQTAVKQNDLALAQQPRQTYQAFIGLLDDYVTIWGEQAFDLPVFIDLLNAGFNNTEFAQIPATLDAVLVSKAGMVQGQTQQITIILGATRDNLPAQTQTNQLIDDQERRLINQYLITANKPQQLGEATNEQSVEQPLRYGLIFFSSQQRLIFTYPRHSDGHAENQLSPYVARIQQQFQLPTTTLSDYPHQESRILDFAASKRSVVGPLLLLNRQMKTQALPLPAAWQWVQQLLQTTDDHHFFKQLLASLDYRNQPQNLTSENVQKLYGQHLFSSVSQLENFYMNPYDYFLKYGLKLRTRAEYTVDSANTGTFFHDYLDHFVKLLTERQFKPEELTQVQLDALNEEIGQTLLGKTDYQILNGPGQMHYYRRRLSKTSAFMTNVLIEQAAHSFLRPLMTEVQFGIIEGSQGLPGLELTLADAKRLSVRGKIDRIDVGSVANNDYYQVIDYKSGDKKFDFTRAYHGLSLQLLTYLQTVANNQQALQLNAAKPVGAFYIHIADTPLKYAEHLNIQEELLKDHRYKGLLIEQPQADYLANLDPQAKSSHSLLYPIKYTKKTDTFKLSSANSGVTADELQLLLQHNQDLLIAAANEIFSGELRIAPYKLSDQETGLQYTDYKSIMMFDAMLPENRYRLLPTLAKDDVLAKLKSAKGDETDA